LRGKSFVFRPLVALGAISTPVGGYDLDQVTETMAKASASSGKVPAKALNAP
jgi:O-acetyl-ADP-ribose deacetylase (regulator of RNase III)